MVPRYTINQKHMTCVWKGLAQAMRLKKSPDQLLYHMQCNNRLTHNMSWRGAGLSVQLLDENFTAIKNLLIENGYQCSTCDPLLLLFGELYKTSITHKYMGTVIQYVNQTTDRMIFVESNRNHFWFDKELTKNHIKKLKNHRKN
jgi:hypothetical protein